MHVLVRYAIIGAPLPVFQAAVADIQEELEARPYLEDPTVRWDSDRQWIAVEVGTHALPGQVEVAAYDDVSDTVFAVVPSWDTFRIQFLDAQALE
jgi:hypothetical protein